MVQYAHGVEHSLVQLQKIWGRVSLPSRHCSDSDRHEAFQTECVTGETSTRGGNLFAMAWLRYVLFCPFKIITPPGPFLEALFLDETCDGVQVFTRWVMCFEG